jgi:hypothetical protein
VYFQEVFHSWRATGNSQLKFTNFQPKQQTLPHHLLLYLPLPPQPLYNTLVMMNNLDNSDKQEIVEDVPRMMSVAMHSPMAIPLPRSFPLREKVTPSRLVTSDDDHKVVSAGASWKVNELVHLPSMHLLERSNVYVSNTEPSVVSQRIAECLRSLSIAATFFDNEVCQT